MADKKISALTGATTPLAGTEVLPIVQSGATVKVAVSDLTAGRAISATQLTLTTGNVIVASGQGIDFSATPGTGTSELFDDYEEGTWTATLTCGTSGTITLDAAYNTGYYTKIGNTVFFNLLIVVTSVASPVGNLIMNLPFATDTTRADNNQSALCIHPGGLEVTAITSIVGAIPFASGAQAYIRKFAAGAVSNLAGDIKAGSYFQISGQYLLS
jgi:hypothetical protein